MLIIDEHTDYTDQIISKNFELFLDHILQSKPLNEKVKRYIEQICGDILMCNLDKLDLLKENIEKNEILTFEEKTYKVYNLLE